MRGAVPWTVPPARLSTSTLLTDVMSLQYCTWHLLQTRSFLTPPHWSFFFFTVEAFFPGFLSQSNRTVAAHFEAKSLWRRELYVLLLLNRLVHCRVSRAQMQPCLYDPCCESLDFSFCTCCALLVKLNIFMVWHEKNLFLMLGLNLHLGSFCLISWSS